MRFLAEHSELIYNIVIHIAVTLKFNNFIFDLTQVSLWIPITYVVVSLFLIVLPCYVKPTEVGMGVGITLLGIPVYYLCVVWQTKPVWFQNILSKCFVPTLLAHQNPDSMIDFCLFVFRTCYVYYSKVVCQCQRRKSRGHMGITLLLRLQLNMFMLGFST